MKKVVIYIHGKGGNIKESEHYIRFFPKYDVIGFDYLSNTPWDAKKEFADFFSRIRLDYSSITIIANSIGAYYALVSLKDMQIEKAYFISPIVNMVKLIDDMMKWSNVTEKELEEKRFIETSFNETLSWEYLSWIRNNPIEWKVNTSILYGEYDNLQSIDTIKSFVESTNAKLIVMPNGEHWFHTKEQMDFLDKWLNKVN